MTGENVQEDESLEYPFVCCEQVSTLQEMATYRVCQSIWCSYISRHDGCPRNTIWRADGDVVSPLESVKGMKLAGPIEKELEEKVKQVGYGLECWLNRLKFSIFTNVVDEFDLSRIDVVNCCVWRPNGKIDYEKSARKLLQDGGLSVEGKFALMSAYCMEDEMKEIPLNALPDSVRKEQFRGAKNLLTYWIRYLKNELDSISVLEDSSLDFTMAWKCYEDHRTLIESFEYFWRRLGNEDRITLAEKCLLRHSIEYTGKWDHIEVLFSSLMPTMNRTLADIAGQYLTRSLISSDTCSSNQLRIWRRFKNDITDEGFADMVHKVLESASYSEYRMRVLMEIWNTACYAKKERVVPKVKMFLDSFNFNSVTHHSILFDLIFRIVSMQPEEDRTSLLRQHLEYLAIVIHDAQLLQKMLDLCMMNSNEQTNFKIEFGRSEALRNVCLELFWYAEFNHIDNKLQWVFSVPDAGGVDVVQAYKKHLLFTAHSRCAHCFDPFLRSIRKWNKLSEFIDQTYVNDTESAFAMKNRIIIRTAFTAIFDCTLHYHFNVVSQIVETVFPADALLDFKRVRLFIFGERLESREYWGRGEDVVDVKFVRNFVAWCCDHDENSVSQFKKSIPQLVIFEGILTRLMRSLFVNKNATAEKLKMVLHRCDEFLGWFVGSDEEVRECKLQGIEHSVVEIKRAIKVNHDQLILEWVFGDDKVAIRRFREEKLTNRGRWM